MPGGGSGCHGQAAPRARHTVTGAEGVGVDGLRAEPQTGALIELDREWSEVLAQHICEILILWRGTHLRPDKGASAEGVAARQLRAKTHLPERWCHDEGARIDAV